MKEIEIRNKQIETTKLFLASSINEFKKERMELGNFIRKINDFIIAKGRYLELFICEDIGNEMADKSKQSQYNNIIRKCDHLYMLIGANAGDATREELDTGLDQFKNDGRPLIHSFFKNSDDSNATVSDLLKRFDDKDDKAHSFYYNRFDNIDFVKLQILLEFTNYRKWKFEDRKVYLGDMYMLDLSTIPLFHDDSSDIYEPLTYFLAVTRKNSYGTGLNETDIKRSQKMDEGVLYE